MTVTVSVKLLYLIPAPKASWIPEAPRHFEKSQWGPEKWASEERDSVCVSVHGDGRRDDMLSACVCSESMAFVYDMVLNIYLWLLSSNHCSLHF